MHARHSTPANLQDAAVVPRVVVWAYSPNSVRATVAATPVMEDAAVANAQVAVESSAVIVQPAVECCLAAVFFAAVKDAMSAAEWCWACRGNG